MAKRMMARVPDDVAEKIESWALRLGLSQAQLMGMAIQAGIDSIIRSVAPMESYSDKQIAAIFRALQREGISLDGLTIGSEENNNDTADNRGKSLTANREE